MQKIEMNKKAANQDTHTGKNWAMPSIRPIRAQRPSQRGSRMSGVPR